MKHSIFLPVGFGQEFARISDPVTAYETITETGHIADEFGYETLWVLDHLLTAPPSPEFIFECWTTVAALLRDTERVRIGQMVSGNGYRNPALLAKMASTVDVLGHGRLTFGIGAGWYEPDYHAFGYEYRDGPARLRQLREAMQIILSMWTDDQTTFDGEFYQVHGAINQPKGVQQPHIPVLIAGGGEKVTLKLAAEYADVCNVIESPDGLRHKFDVLRKHCANVGRDYESITRTTTTICIIADTDEQARAQVPPGAGAIYPGDVADYGLIGTPDTIRERLAGYEAAGVQELAINFNDPTDLDLLRRYGHEFIKGA